jgi:CBS domain-containing protein
MKVSDLMTTDVVTTTVDTPLRDVARALVEHEISGMPVCDDAGAVLGVVSEWDILFKERGRDGARGGVLAWLLDTPAAWELEKTEARTAGQAMTTPPITVSSVQSAAAAARKMTEHGVNRLPVVSMHGRLVGILTRTDLVRAFVRPDDEIAAEIRDDVLERTLWAEPGRVEVVARDGDVELVGELDTPADVEILEKLVTKVPGVVSVRSTVVARHPSRRAHALSGGR